MRFFITFILVGFSLIKLSAQNLDLILPKNNEVIEDSLVEFIWNLEEDCFSYHIQVSDNLFFTPVVIDSDNILTLNITLDIGFNKTMFWRVIGNKLTGNADTSETRIINTIDFTQLNNLFFRFIADSSSSTTMAGDSVIQWNDISANNLNISQPNTSMRPLLISWILFSPHAHICGLM